MGFDYLKNKNWRDISREERGFCIDLICQLRHNYTESAFIAWLIKTGNLELREPFDGKRFEIGVEVCYYRDLIFEHEFQTKTRFANKKSIRGLLKRTFDLCIFLPHDIIIIEAKAAKGMTNHQISHFRKDKSAIETCHQELNLTIVKVHLIGHVAGEYAENPKSLISTKDGAKHFDGILTWEQIQNNSNSGYILPPKLQSIYFETDNMTNYQVNQHKLIEKLSEIVIE